MFDGAISHMCKMGVRSVSIIDGNPLKNLLLILMSIAHSSSLLQISYLLMTSYKGGMYRVVIGSILVFRFMWKLTGSHRMGHRSTMLHSGVCVLLCGSGLLILKVMRQIRKMMKKISLVVQHF